MNGILFCSFQKGIDPKTNMNTVYFTCPYSRTAPEECALGYYKKGKKQKQNKKKKKGKKKLVSVWAQKQGLSWGE